MWGTQGTPGPRAGARVPSIGKPGSGARSQNPDASQPQGPRRRERYAGVGRAHALTHVLTRAHALSHTCLQLPPRPCHNPLLPQPPRWPTARPAPAHRADTLTRAWGESSHYGCSPRSPAGLESKGVRGGLGESGAAASGVPGQGLGGLGLSRARSAQTTPLGAPFPPAPAGRSSAHRTGLRVRRPAPASCRHVLLLAHAPRVRDANRPRGSKAESSRKGGNGGEHWGSTPTLLLVTKNTYVYVQRRTS